MENISSKYNGNIVSKVSDSKIESKTSIDVESKASLKIQSEYQEERDAFLCTAKRNASMMFAKYL